MVDIIIPAYNAHKTIEKTLFSILYQDYLEKINTYIVNDNSDKDYSEFVTFFSNFMNIKELVLNDNKGPGVARQYGIDHSNGEYIIFLDSDDVLSNCYAIKRLITTIQSKKSDLVISTFVEETKDILIEHHNDTIWLHGKAYRRAFLEKNNIRFNNSRANEDNGFNQLLLLHEPKITNIKEVTYIWCDNNMSITRKNNHEYQLNGLDGYVYNINWAIEMANKNHCDPTKIAQLAYRSLVTMYCYYLKFKEPKLIKTCKCLREKSKLFSLDENQKLDVMEHQIKFTYNRNTRQYILNACITFSQFLEQIDKI